MLNIGGINRLVANLKTEGFRFDGTLPAGNDVQFPKCRMPISLSVSFIPKMSSPLSFYCAIILISASAISPIAG
jgi:hypothetical protein